MFIVLKIDRPEGDTRAGRQRSFVCDFVSFIPQYD